MLHHPSTIQTLDRARHFIRRLTPNRTMSEYIGLEEKLEKVKAWLRTQGHLPQNIEDQFLRRFIVSSDCDVEKSQKLIDLNFTMRSRAPEIFNSRDPFDKDISNYLKYGDTVPLPKVTDKNYKVIVLRCAREPEYFIFSVVLKAILMVGDIRLANDPQITSGEVPIFDMARSSFSHLSKVSLSVLRKYMAYSQEAHPVRLKQIHIINISPLVDKILTLVKPFMKSEVAAMLHIHTSMESLYKFVPRDILPEEYGGYGGKLQDMKQEWVNQIYENRDYFLDESRWKVDDTKRPLKEEKIKTRPRLFSNFKSLEID